MKNFLGIVIQMYCMIAVLVLCAAFVVACLLPLILSNLYSPFWLLLFLVDPILFALLDLVLDKVADVAYKYRIGR